MQPSRSSIFHDLCSTFAAIRTTTVVGLFDPALAAHYQGLATLSELELRTHAEEKGKRVALALRYRSTAPPGPPLRRKVAPGGEAKRKNASNCLSVCCLSVGARRDGLGWLVGSLEANAANRTARLTEQHLLRFASGELLVAGAGRALPLLKNLKTVARIAYPSATSLLWL